jgi:hypothetical protein
VVAEAASSYLKTNPCNFSRCTRAIEITDVNAGALSQAVAGLVRNGATNARLIRAHVRDQRRALSWQTIIKAAAAKAAAKAKKSKAGRTTSVSRPPFQDETLSFVLGVSFFKLQSTACNGTRR